MFVETLTDEQINQLHALYQTAWCTSAIAFARVLTDGVFKAFVFDVIVASEDRGRGVGGKLMDHIVAYSALARVKHIELYCLPDLIPFYERWGFSADVGGVVLMRSEGRT